MTSPARMSPGDRVGYASGVFDLFHIGHLNIVTRARAMCDWLVVGVASDVYVSELKGMEPVIPEDERMAILASLSVVDEVVLDTSPDKTVAWRKRPFDVIFKGDDWRGVSKGAALERDMASLGVEVVYFPYTHHTSSTKLRELLDLRILHLGQLQGPGCDT